MKEKNQTELGAIKIHKQVIASVAKIAAIEVEGVKTVGKNFEIVLYEILGASSNLSGLKVEIDKNEDVRIEIGIIVKYGYRLAEIASNVQEAIFKAAETMLNINLKEVNVNILGIAKEAK